MRIKDLQKLYETKRQDALGRRQQLLRQLQAVEEEIISYQGALQALEEAQKAEE
jgi:predicted ribosome quality control (RQC) complex YloA/Tae2 family protein